MNDFSVLNRDDRNEPVVVGRTARENFSVHFVFEDHDTTILRTMHNKRVAGVKLDCLAVSREASHQIGSASNCQRPTPKTKSEPHECAFGNRVALTVRTNKST